LNLVLWFARFRLDRGTAIPRMMNPAVRLNLVARCGTGSRTAPQGFEDGELRLAYAGKQRIVEAAPGFQAQSISLDGNTYPTPLQLG